MLASDCNGLFARKQTGVDGSGWYKAFSVTSILSCTYLRREHLQNMPQQVWGLDDKLQSLNLGVSEMMLGASWLRFSW